MSTTATKGTDLPATLPHSVFDPGERADPAAARRPVTGLEGH